MSPFRLSNPFCNDGLYGISLPVKTKNSERTIQIPDYLIEELILQAKRYKEAKKFAGSIFEDGGYVLFRANGKSFHKSIIEDDYRKFIDSLSIPYIPWHCAMRHFYATLLKDNGVPVKAIQASLGHAHAQTTDIYIFKSEKEPVDLAPVMDELWHSLFGEVDMLRREQISEICISDELISLASSLTSKRIKTNH